MAVGEVAIVGAGPGDADLITVRALHRLRAADIVVYDRLVDRRLLEVAGGARHIFAGKAPARHSMSQDEINELLIAHARRGRRVVRLKGGDPFVFGRGGEEALALAEAGIPFEVVPGVSSAHGVPACAGIPVTHRGVARSFTVVTGHPSADGAQVDWTRLATSADTLVILMGIERLATIAAALIAGGRRPSTPVAVVHRGATAAQRTVVATLDRIADAVAAAALESPATIVVGDVVRLHRALTVGMSIADLNGAASSHGRAARRRPVATSAVASGADRA